MVNAKTGYRSVLLMSLCLIVAILIPYGQVKQFDFIGYDDELYVTQNHHVQAGLTVKGLKWAFTTSHAGSWHPLTWLSHMLDYEIYGLNPMGHHWTNLQLHMANTLLLFFILQLMTGALWRSAVVAALFALHPLHVESVAWVAERKDVLSTFFGMLFFLAYWRYVKQPRLIYYLLVIILLSLGLMSKPMLVTFPFVLLLLDFWPLNRFQYRADRLSRADEETGLKGREIFQLIREKIPLFVLVIFFGILTYQVQSREGAVGTFESFSMKARIANAFVSYVKYIAKAIWPIDLAVFYPHPGDTLPWWQAFGAAIIVASVSFLTIRVSKNYPFVVVGWLWYLGTLVPVIGLVQVGFQAMADRYTYIPLIGIFIILVWGGADVLGNWHFGKMALAGLAVIILSALTVCTYFQLGCWKNRIALFSHALKVTDNNYVAHNNLGVAFFEKGKFDEAIFHYKEILKILPDDAGAFYNLGNAMFSSGNIDQAAFYYKEALRIKPEDAKVHNNLANVLFSQGKSDESVFHYTEALRINPENSDAHSNMANVLFVQGKIYKAVSHYNEALRIDPSNKDAHYNFGSLLLKQKKYKEALAHFSETIKIDPGYVKGYNSIGIIMARQGKFKKAGDFFSKALQIDSNFVEARKNLNILEEALSSNEP
jgi:tetratricopeptide (TPR) repeat protein